MKHLFKPQVVKGLWALLILLLIIKLFWFLIEVLWLSTSGMGHVEEKGSKALYYRVKLSPGKAPAPTKKKSAEAVRSIKDIKLLAIYNALDLTVVTVEYKKKTKVLGTGDEINGFVLEGAGSNFATFSKESKTYKVDLLKSKKDSKSVGTIKKADPSSLPSEESAKPVGDVVDAGDHKIVDKSLLIHYSKNIDDIYKDIGITDIKKGKDVEGFRISFIRRGSPFAKLGLERGDIIKSINGQKIDSYSAAFDVYKNIQNIENLTMVIQRGKEEMELEYEVN